MTQTDHFSILSWFHSICIACAYTVREKYHSKEAMIYNMDMIKLMGMTINLENQILFGIVHPHHSIQYHSLFYINCYTYFIFIMYLQCILHIIYSYHLLYIHILFITYIYACKYMHYMCARYIQGPRRGHQIPRNWRYCYDLPCGCYKLKSGPLSEYWALFTLCHLFRPLCFLLNENMLYK